MKQELPHHLLVSCWLTFFNMRAWLSQLPYPNSATVEIRKIAPQECFFNPTVNWWHCSPKLPGFYSSLEWPWDHKQQCGKWNKHWLGTLSSWLCSRLSSLAMPPCDFGKSLNLFLQLSNADRGPFFAHLPGLQWGETFCECRMEAVGQCWLVHGIW